MRRAAQVFVRVSVSYHVYARDGNIVKVLSIAEALA